MANHKSALKAHRRSLTRKQINQTRESKIKTFIKKANDAIGGDDFANAVEAVRKAESEIIRAVSKGVFRKNTAARRVSRLVRALKAKFEPAPSA